MKKLCRNAKNYKLTEGQEYEILQEENGYIRVINDSGKNVKYDATLFQELEIALPPPPPAITEQDCINSIAYNDNVLSYRNINSELKTEDIVLSAVSTNDFSCGIIRIEGINNLCGLLENGTFVNTTEDDFLELKKRLFKTVFDYWANGQAGMWMCSTNQNQNYEDYHDVLDNELSTHHCDWFFNPNSTNQIKLWYGIINQ